MPELYPYQTFGAEWLGSRRGAILADDMGLGKSAQAVTACDDLLADPVLIICPAVARINWTREFKKFSDHPRNFFLCRETAKPPPLGANVVMSYELATAYEKEKALTKHRWDVAIVDEGHYLKSWEAKRTKAILGAKGIVRRCRKVWALTGTPMPNHPGELWTWLFTLGATQLTYARFCDRFCEFDTDASNPMRKITGAKASATAELQTILAKVMLRRLRGDIDLPPISFYDVFIEPGRANLPDVDLKQLQGQLMNLSIEMRGLSNDQVFAMLEAIAPSVSTLRRLHGMQKVHGCADLIGGELQSQQYKKIVVFCVHKEVAKQLSQKLSAFFPVVVNGDTPAAKRQEHIDRFQEDPRCQVFIANIHAAGTAITLTASDQVFFVEQDWVPANNAQAAKRCHRIGQKNPVTVRCASISGSIDEKITAVLRRKTSDITRIFGSSQN